MKRHLPVVTITSLPAEVKYPVLSCVEREARAYVRRRGAETDLFFVKGQYVDGYLVFTFKDRLDKLPPGRYEIQVRTSLVDVVHTTELRLGTRLEVRDPVGASKTCEGCC